MQDLRVTNKPATSCEDFDLYRVIRYGKQNVGFQREYDLYIDDVSYGEFGVVDSFEKLLYPQGYGVVIKKNKEQVKQVLKSIDWTSYSFKPANGSNKIGKSDIIAAYEEAKC